MHQENNQIISLEKYIQAFKIVYKKKIQSAILMHFLIFGIAFAIIYTTYNPSISFFIYTIIGITIILSLEHIVNINVINKVEKAIHAYNIDTFKHGFKEEFKQQYMNVIKINMSIYLLITGILTYIYLTYYSDDTWFKYILVIIGFFILSFISIEIFFVDKFVKMLEEETETKAVLL
ncbi:MAG: hypothetical protein HF967_09455 [Methanosarcinales archaeon]|nr:hypothetical protein [Methanosarcinales archaeon]